MKTERIDSRSDETGRGATSACVRRGSIEISTATNRTRASRFATRPSGITALMAVSSPMRCAERAPVARTNAASASVGGPSVVMNTETSDLRRAPDRRWRAHPARFRSHRGAGIRAHRDRSGQRDAVLEVPPTASSAATSASVGTSVKFTTMVVSGASGPVEQAVARARTTRSRRTDNSGLGIRPR